MLKRLVLVAALTAVAALAACQTDRDRGAYGGSRERPADVYGTQAERAGTLAADRQFLTQAAAGGQMEVRLGQVATQRAQDEEVRRLAQRLVDDHTRANNELRQIATAQGMTAPTQLEPQHQRTVDRLSAMSGQEFDRAFLREIIEHHQRDIAQFDRQANQAQDQRVRDFAQRTLPTLREHLRQARDLAGRLGIDAARPDPAAAEHLEPGTLGTEPQTDPDLLDTGAQPDAGQQDGAM